MAEHVEGLKELADALRTFSDKLAKKALRSAVNAGATVIKKEMVANAPVLSGALKANIYQRQIREESNAQQQTYFVGVRNGKAKYANTAKNRRAGLAGKEYKNGGKTFYWKFLEFGTSTIVARPFVRPAFEEQKEAAVEAIKEKLKVNIDRIAADIASRS
ncbi:MAG: HK97-gp10 family putative phage morphogenesis protein [Pseudomonadota bacterium]